MFLTKFVEKVLCITRTRHGWSVMLAAAGRFANGRAGVWLLGLLIVLGPLGAVGRRHPVRASESLRASRPNVVLIVSDDQAWTDFGFMGHDTVRTPHLDRLSREGVTFTRGYVPTSLCRASLATLITGLYPHQHRIVGNDPVRPEGMAADAPAYLALCDSMVDQLKRVPTIAGLLGERGYVSHQSGKWWEGHYRNGGFTHGMTHGDRRRGGRHGDDGLRIGRAGMEPLFEFIDSAGNQPFFVWYAPFLPHRPHHPPPRLLEKYRDRVEPKALARYYAMCEWFDETCGQLLDYLDQKGLRDDTLVVFVTDNGWIQRTEDTAVPDGWPFPFAPRSKRSPYEAGTRTPILLRWPSRLRPARHDVPVSSIDIAPTIVRACGLEPPAAWPGINLLDICNGTPVSRDAVFGETFSHDVIDVDRPERSLIFRWCIHDGWKLILPHEVSTAPPEPSLTGRHRRTQLFHVVEDPDETRDLAAEHPEIVRRLTARIDAWYDPAP